MFDGVCVQTNNLITIDNFLKLLYNSGRYRVSCIDVILKKENIMNQDPNMNEQMNQCCSPMQGDIS